MTAVRVHIIRPPEPEPLALLRELLPPAVALTLGPEPPAPADYEVLVGGRPTREQLAASPRLRALVVPFAGIPLETRAVLADFPDLAVHNLHYNAAPTAEMGIALLLAAAKSIVPMDRTMRASDWRPRYHGGGSILLEGKTALVLGYGEVGRRVALACRGLGMKVIATRRRTDVSTATADGVALHPPERLRELLPRAHALIVCLPETPTTRGLIGEAELALLPPGAVLVNIGRGPVVQQEPLYRALADGRLGAAGLDVWYRYPKEEPERGSTAPADFPFHELENVVMSPHRAGDTEEQERARMRHLAALLTAFARGGAVPGRVDIDAGY